MGQVKLRSGWTSTCKRCGKEILWQKTPSGKLTPVDPDGQSHWVTCPNADEFKQKPAPAPEQGSLF